MWLWLLKLPSPQLRPQPLSFEKDAMTEKHNSKLYKQLRQILRPKHINLRTAFEKNTLKTTDSRNLELAY